jgi:hypothetical protein
LLRRAAGKRNSTADLEGCIACFGCRIAMAGVAIDDTPALAMHRPPVDR